MSEMVLQYKSSHIMKLFLIQIWAHGIFPTMPGPRISFTLNVPEKRCSVFEFFKQIFRNDIFLYVLMNLNDQSTSNESNSAQWNGLHPVFLSNFINKIFLYLSSLKKSFTRSLLLNIMLPGNIAFPAFT